MILVRLFLNIVRLLSAPLWYPARLALRPRARWVHVRLRSNIVEIDKPVPPFMRWVPAWAETRPTELRLLDELVDLIVEDSRVEGVVFDIPPLTAGWGRCESLRELLLRLRAAEKRVVVYLSGGGGNRELLIASAAERILAAPQTQLGPLGLAASVTYLRGLLDKAGLEVEVRRRAEYKTAVEPAVRTEMSEAQREQTEALLATVNASLRAGLASRVGDEGVDECFETALFDAEAARARGLIDGVCYEDELPTRLVDPPVTTPVVRAPRYFAWRRRRLFLPVLPARYVAIVPVHGAIRGGPSGSAGGRWLKRTITALRAARKSSRVAGVVLHVDSPGGSVLASDRIGREVERLRELKPVVACFGDVAASGGYYVSVCADAIVARPLTITGSIGVVSARLVTEPLMEWLGMSVSTVRTAPHADMRRKPGRLSDAEAEIEEREIERFYRSFVALVARGRGRDVEETEKLARGRVWSGRDALERGLIDRTGGLRDAIEEVRARLEGRLSERRRRRLRGKVLAPMRLELPPAEPRAPEEAVALGLLRRVCPSAADVAELAASEGRVLVYAPDLPRID